MIEEILEETVLINNTSKTTNLTINYPMDQSDEQEVNRQIDRQIDREERIPSKSRSIDISSWGYPSSARVQLSATEFHNLTHFPSQGHSRSLTSALPNKSTTRFRNNITQSHSKVTPKSPNSHPKSLKSHRKSQKITENHRELEYTRVQFNKRSSKCSKKLF